MSVRRAPKMTSLELRMAAIAIRTAAVDGSGGVGTRGRRGGIARGRSGSRTSESSFTQAQYDPLVW